LLPGFGNEDAPCSALRERLAAIKGMRTLVVGGMPDRRRD